MTQVIAKLRYLHIAPRKVRLIANTLRGLSVNEAEAQLLYRPHRSSEHLLKLLRSAVANAKNNNKLNPNNLFIKTIFVDQGPIIKRFLPRSMGRATPLHKKMSHITLILEESFKLKEPRFNIAVTKKIKKSDKKANKKALLTGSGQAKTKVESSVKATEKKVGLFKRMFRRKSV